MERFVVLLLLFAYTAYGEIYTWKDARGTAFYTNSLDEIPARFLSRARLLDVATGKKSPITASHPGVGATPGQQGPSQQTPVPQAPAQQAPAQQTALPNPAVTTPAAQEVSSAKWQARAQKRALRRAQRLQNPTRSQEE